WFDGYLTADAFCRVVLQDIIPAVDQKAGQRNLIVKVVSGTHPHVIKRDRQREQQRARIVPVVFGLDDLKAERCYKFADINLKALADGCLIAEICLTDVTEDVRSCRLGRIHKVLRWSIVQVEPES